MKTTVYFVSTGMTGQSMGLHHCARYRAWVCNAPLHQVQSLGLHHCTRYRAWSSPLDQVQSMGLHHCTATDRELVSSVSSKGIELTTSESAVHHSTNSTTGWVTVIARFKFFTTVCIVSFKLACAAHHKTSESSYKKMET